VMVVSHTGVGVTGVPRIQGLGSPLIQSVD
jgi:hypothetical protein